MWRDTPIDDGVTITSPSKVLLLQAFWRLNAYVTWKHFDRKTKTQGGGGGGLFF